jgi:CzcA family heavy metal efflux pump
MFLTRGALRNPILILNICIVVVVLSLISLTRLPANLFPNITLPVILVSTTYTGASAQVMEQSVTYPLEQAVTQVAGVTQLLSTTRQGLSIIQVWFDWGTNLDAAETEVIQNVQRAIQSLPTGVNQPFILKFDVSNIPVAQVAVGGGHLDARALYDLAYNTIAPQLQRLPGVSQASVHGGLVRQLNVNVDPHRLVATGLSLQDVEDAISRENVLLPSGSLQNPEINYQLNVPTLLTDAEAIRSVVVTARQGVPVTVGDVADVEDAAADPTQIVNLNGTPGILLYVSTQPGANPIEAVNALRRALPRLAGIPQGVTLTIGFDQSRYIRAAVATLEREAVQGALLAFLIILVFLRSFRSLVIIGLGIPLSVATTLLLLYFTGQSLNVFTLGGLTLAMGRLVDDAIVVRENITRHLAVPGTPVRQAVVEATEEVGLPVLASTATTIAVFFPVVFLTGIARLLFVPMALTVVFAMVASYLVSMTIDPLLSIQLFQPVGEERATRPGMLARAGRWGERLTARLDEGYQAMLSWTLRHAPAVIGGIALLFVGSMAAARGIGTEFFPNTDESQFTISVQAPQGMAVQAASAIAEEVADVARRVIPSSDIVTVVTNTGVPPSGGGAFMANAGPNYGRVQVRLVPPVARGESSDDLADRVRRALAGKFPGVQMFFQTGGLQHAVVNFGSAAPIDIQLLGYDTTVGARLALEVARRVALIPGAVDVQITPQGNIPDFTVEVDRKEAALLGLSATTIAQAVNTAMAGDVATASKFLDPVTGNEYNIVVQLMGQYRTHPDDLANTPLAALVSTGVPTTPAGLPRPATPILLRDIARITIGSEPLQIDRKNEQRVIDVTANTLGRPLGAVSADVQRELAGLPFPAGFAYHLAGQTEQQQGAFGSLLFATLLAVMLVYMILASQFRSFAEPFIIMFTIPLGLIGVVWILLVTGTTLSVMGYMGIITMVGIVVSNGILLVDYANKLRVRGLDLHDAIVRAGRIRLRPILMTALATILGLIPMALGMGEGAETNMPLARVVIGGLAISTGLTLFLIPALYMLLERRLSHTRQARD